MNVKQTVKKMSAVLTGVAMLGATVAGAMALTLNDYPKPLVDNGVFNGKIVVGKTAATSDVLGAIDIAASLQAAAKTSVSVSGGAVTVSGGEANDIIVGNSLTAASGFSSPIDYTDVPFLVDSSVDIDIGSASNTYDYHDEIRLDPSASSLGLNLTTGLAWDGSDDYKDDVFFTAGAGTIGYYFVFDEALDSGNYISDATSNDPITLEFMGRKLKITSATATSMTVDIANEYYLQVGDSTKVDGKTVELLDVSSNGNSVVVKVDGKTSTVTSSERVNGLRITVRDAFSSDSKADRSANLLIGEKTTDTFNNNDEYIGEDSSNPEWRWVLSGLNTSSPTIGVKFAANLNKESGEDYEHYKSVIYEGEAIQFPDNFAKISFDSLTQSAYSKYNFDVEESLELYTSRANADSGTVERTADVIKVRSDKSNSGLYVGSEKTEEVYIAVSSANSSNFDVYYKDTSTNKPVKGLSNVAPGGTAFTVDYSKTSMPVTINANALVLTDSGTSETLTVGFTKAGSGSNTYINYLGTGSNDDTKAGLSYGAVNIAGHEADLRMLDGIRIMNPDSEFQQRDGSLTLEFPADNTDFRANIVLSGEGSSVSQETDSGAYTVNAFALGAGVLDVDAGDLLGNTPLLVVGGPAVNTIAKDLMGNPSPEQIGKFFEAGKAKIKLYEDKNAILVAGYTAQDTLGASYVLADYGAYDFQGMSEVEVLVASLEDLKISAPELPSSIDELETSSADESAPTA